MSELSPNGETNFWVFYSKNTLVIDSIINVNIKRNIQQVDREDIRQDVLMALERCNILQGYRPENCAFNTYFTNTVRGYIQHWFDKQRNHKWRPFPTEKQEDDGTTLRFERVLYKSLNGVVDEDNESIPTDISVSNGIEEEVSFNEKVEMLREKLDHSLSNIFELLVCGWNNTEIANQLSTSKANVGLKVGKISQIGMSIISQ
jgi:RNA polymerase sigma factor (sigma-70 family)